MANLFDGLKKLSDDDIRLQIALFQSVNLGNALKETGARTVGKIMGIANMIAGKSSAQESGNDYRTRGIEDIVIENINKLKSISRNELDIILRNTLIEKCNILVMNGLDENSGDELISLSIIRESAKVYSLNQNMAPSLLAETIAKKYYEQFLVRLHKSIIRENAEAAKITDNNLQQALNKASIEIKRDMAKRIIISEFSGSGIGKIIRRESNTANLTVIVDYLGLGAFDILNTVIMSVYDAVLGINRISRAIFAQFVWVCVKAYAEKLSVNTDMLPGYISADRQFEEDETEKVFLEKLAKKNIIEKEISKSEIELEKLKEKQMVILTALKKENDDYNEFRSEFQKLEGLKNLFLENAGKTKDEIKKYYADVVSTKRKYDNAEKDLKKRAEQAREILDKINERQAELSASKNASDLLNEELKVAVIEKANYRLEDWKKHFIGLSFDEGLFEVLVREFTNSEILKIEEYLEEMYRSSDISAFGILKNSNVSELTTEETSKIGNIRNVVCMAGASKNAVIEYDDRYIISIIKQ